MNDTDLSAQDYQSSVWIKLQVKLEKRLELLRKKNDGKLNENDTALLRGRIAEIKKILAMANPSPTVAADDD